MNKENTREGILKTIHSGAGFLRAPDEPLKRQDDEVYVPESLINRFNLEEGVLLSGPVKSTNKGLRLSEVDSVCDLDPEEFRDRTKIDDLTPIMPEDKFDLFCTNEISMQIIDLLAPIGKGTRCLIVSPPRAGKTTILEQLSQAIHKDSPDARNLVVLVDERPEEVTQFKRNVNADVIASSNDQPPEDHVKLIRIMKQHIRCELEAGKDVVVLLDSLTRMARAFNLEGSNQTGRTLSGGVDAGAMEVPRKFFGLARNIENGGSITIVATALRDTGSQMDEVFFEEFKGSGNSEIVLDRSLADAHIHPAIDIAETGTRKEELLHADSEIEKIRAIRRWLLNQSPKEAIETLRSFLEDHPTRESVMRNLPDF